MKSDPHKIVISLCISIILLILVSCHSDKSNESRSVFRYNEAAGISSLDPAYAKNLANIQVCNQLYNGLVQLDDQLNVRPAIAKKWEVLNNGLEYRFTLRDDVCFHDHKLFKEGKGRRVNAEDFVYSFNRIADEKTASPGAWIFNRVNRVGDKLDVEAYNDSTLIIRLTEEFPPFLGILSMQYSSVVPREIVDHYGQDFRIHPVGTGPFYLKYWKEGIKLVLLKNTHYFENDENEQKLPYLDAVSVSFLKDKQSAFLEFVKGNLDFMSGIDPNYKDELLTRQGKLNPKYEGRITLLTEPYLNTEYLGILVDSSLEETKDNPLNNKLIRKAINYSFDRNLMIRFLRNGIGTPGIYGMIPPGMPSFDPDLMPGYSYDPDKAKKLLKEAGYPNGKGLPVIHLSTTPEYLDLCKFIQHQLDEQGIPLEIDVNTPAALRELKAQSKTPFFRASWVADYPDAENYLSLFYSGNFAPNGPNYTHFKDLSFDKLYTRSLSELNDSVRYELYRQMDRLVMNNAPVVILYYDQVLRFTGKNITGLGSNPVNLLNLKHVKKDSDKLKLN